MRTLITLTLAGLIIFGLFITGCERETGEVDLSLSFTEGQKLFWETNSRRTIKEFENDSLLGTYENKEASLALEQVQAVYPDSSARIRRLAYYNIPSDKISTIDESTPAAWTAEFIQTADGRIVDYFPSDTVDLQTVEYFKKMYEQMSPHYPGGTLPVGYNWSNTVRVKMPDGRITDAMTTYRIRSIVRVQGYDCAVIESKGTIVLPFEKEYPAKNEKVVGLSTKDVEGTTCFAFDEGFIVRYDETYDSRTEGSRIIGDNQTTFVVLENGNYSYSLVSAGM